MNCATTATTRSTSNETMKSTGCDKRSSNRTSTEIHLTGRIMKWREVVCFPYFQISGVSKLRLKQIQLRVEVVSFSEIKCRSCVFGGPKLL